MKNNEMIKEWSIENLFRVQSELISEYLKKFIYPWEVLPKLSSTLLSLGEGLSPEEFDRISENIWISKGATVSEKASIFGPAIICSGAEIRPSAYLRGSVFVGVGAVVGNSSEIKNAILMDRVQVPHFSYVGDSILGYTSHLGGGVLVSNLKLDKSDVVIKHEGISLPTGLKKVGAFLGDGVEVGCQTVLNPGTIIGQGSVIYPLSMVRGYVPEKSIYKKAGEIVEKR